MNTQAEAFQPVVTFRSYFIQRLWK